MAAGACSSACPFGLAATTAGDIYTIAGSASGSSGSSGDGGAATSALLSSPSGVALDPAGNLYIADAGNNRAQFVAAKACSSACPWGLSATTPGYVYTVAGSASGAEGHAGIGGLATSALLDAPAGVGLGSSGDLYVADTYNYEVAEVPAAVNPAAFTTGYTYNAYGDLTSTTDPDGDVTSATYDDLGNELSSTDARGYTTSYSYDADNELTGVSLPGSLTESYTYDGDGNRLTSVDARGKTTTYTYDPLGRVVSVEDPDGHTTSYSYDAAGNELSVTDPDGDVTSYAYDHDNRLETVTQANSTTLGYTYDPDGNEASYTNGAGGTTTYGYNDLDELTSVTDPLARATSYTYNPDGDQLTLTQPGAKVTTWTYNGDDQVAGASYSDGVTHPVSYTYTPDGQVATMADASGTSSYAYDDAGRLVAYQDGAGATVSYAYDPDGDVTTLGYPNGYQVSQAYDALGRLSSVTDWLGGTTSFSYDADSDLTGASYPNGVSVSRQLRQRRPALVHHRHQGLEHAGVVLLHQGRRRQPERRDRHRHAGGGGHRVTATTPCTSSRRRARPSYGYDNANDLTTGPGGITQAFDADGELCWSASASGSCSSPPSGATTYSYSAQGDRTATTPASGSSTSYSWDEADHLAQVATGSASTSFVYDGTGLRQSETAGSATTYFTWDTEGSLPLLLSDGANSYIYGPAGTPVEQVSSSGTPTYLLADQLGSTRALTNPLGRSRPPSVTTPGATSPARPARPPRRSCTPAQYYDSATGLYYMQARYYDPASGQFLSLDPDVGLTRAPYNYAGDDPVNGSDPTGRFLQSDGGGYAVNEAIPSGQMAGSSVAASPCGNGETFNEEEESEGGEPGPGAFGPSGEGGVAGVEGGPPDVYGFASSNVWYRLDALRTSLGANVVAELDIGDYSSLGSNLARSNAPIPGTFRFFVEHAGRRCICGGHRGSVDCRVLLRRTVRHAVRDRSALWVLLQRHQHSGEAARSKPVGGPCPGGNSRSVYGRARFENIP